MHIARPTRSTIRASLLLATSASVVLVSGCGSSGSTSSSPAPTSAPAVSTSARAGAVELTAADTWVKATDGAKDGTMTAAFGVLTNTTDKPLTIISATNSASARTELHEMAMENGTMVMRPIAGGIKVPAKGTTTLEPGGLHVMIMDVDKPIKVGDDVTVTLEVDDGSSVTFTALAKEFAGANESYSPEGGSGMDMSGEDMSGMPTASASAK